MYGHRKIEMELAGHLRKHREEMFWEHAFNDGWSPSTGTLNPYGVVAVAEKVGVSKATFCRWENWGCFPKSQEHWELWAGAVDAEIDFRLELR